MDLASNGTAAAAAAAAAEVVVGIASAHLHTWHLHNRMEEALRVDTHHWSGGYKTSLSAVDPVVVHHIRKLA